MRRRFVNIGITLALLAASLALFQYTGLDLWLQDHWFDFSRQTWWVDKKAVWPRLIFYTGPKAVVIALGLGLLALALIPTARWPRWLPIAKSRRRCAVVVVCLAMVPGMVGWMKSRSDVFCPWALERYGGMQPYHKLFDPLPPGVPPDCGKCFPAGHASGGFALMSLALLFQDRRLRLVGWGCGLAVGWTMGIYQMLKGAHFLSHTVTTMGLAIVLIQVIAWLGKVDEPKAGAK
jgi:membrane-associated PAP2 superfamily phosphatase